MARASSESLLFRWRNAFCSAAGPPPTTRHVLWGLSKHMALDGSDCFPGQELLAGETGLNLSTVKRNLEAAERMGWIGRQPRRRGCRESWRYGTDYVPRFPIPIGGVEPPNIGGAVPNYGAAVPTLVAQRPPRSSG